VGDDLFIAAPHRGGLQVNREFEELDSFPRIEQQRVALCAWSCDLHFG
jgi:hypothetical protein